MEHKNREQFIIRSRLYKEKICNQGGIQELRGQDEGGRGGQKMSVFVHDQGIKTVHAGEEIKKWQNSAHLVVE